ncbi:MAG: MotA/TolQ/ExbB proton channel family protein [Candidatus Binatia bacterium]
MAATSILDQGGPVMYLLLALSVLSTAIVLLKLYQFWRLRLRRLDFVDETMEALDARRWEDADRLLAGQVNPAARVLRAALATGASEAGAVQGLETELSRLGSAELRSLESWLRALSAIAHLSPLLGLLGTVLGMIRAFMAIQSAGPRVDPTTLSGGIWVALLTTAFGLAVAIPSMAAFYLLEGEVDRFKGALGDVCLRLLGRQGETRELRQRLGASRLAREDYGV